MKHSSGWPVWCQALALSLAVGCRCGGAVNQLQSDFRVAPETQFLEFGRVLEGQSPSHDVLLLNVSLVGVIVTATTSAPFSVAPDVEIAAGGEARVPVTFHAQGSEASAAVVFRSGERTVEVSVHGTGVRPLTCTPSRACAVSTYSFEENRCIETSAQDDVPCHSENLCLEQERCKSGACVGVARTCDDNNECTVDGCALASGCVSSPRACPAPTQPCRVATCDKKKGCGSAQAPDGTPCGPVDCVTANLCVAGACVSLPTPEGILCRPRLACMPEGRCRQQRCDRGDAGVWEPAWSRQVAGVPSSGAPAMLSSGGNLFALVCGLKHPRADAGDAGADGGEDGGGAEGGDGGEVDGGFDAGEEAADASVCGLASWTSNGFDRFVEAFQNDQEPQLINVGPRGVALLLDGGLELRSSQTGEVFDRLEVRVGLDSIAVKDARTLALLLDDGTLVEWTDAGVVPVAALGEPGALALDARGNPWVWHSDVGRLTHVVGGGDAGVALLSASIDGGGNRSLVGAFDGIVAGARELVRRDDDAGTLLSNDVRWHSPEGVLLEPEPRGVLSGPSALFAFSKRCPPPDARCDAGQEELWLREKSLSTSAAPLEVRVFPGGAGARLGDVALVEVGGLSGGVAAVVEMDEAALDAGAQAGLQVFVQGKRALVCPLPLERSRVRSSHLGDGQLFVFAESDDGGVWLDAYEMYGLSRSTRGWPQPSGFEGQRRQMP